MYECACNAYIVIHFSAILSSPNVRCRHYFCRHHQTLDFLPSDAPQGLYCNSLQFLLLGHYSFSFTFSNYNACWVGFRSVDWLGHCITFGFFCLEKLFRLQYASCHCTSVLWMWAVKMTPNIKLILLMLSAVPSLNRRETAPFAMISYMPMPWHVHLITCTVPHGVIELICSFG